MSVPIAGALGALRAWGPWAGVVAIAFYVGADRAGVDNRLQNLARDDTANMVMIHRDLRDIDAKVDTLIMQHRRLTCFVLKNSGPDCPR